MREANIEDLQKDVGKIGKEIEESATVKGFGTWENPSAGKPKPPQSGPKPAEASEKPATPPSPTPLTSKESDQETNQDA
jgi:hypothetical protein